jgi:hypothetical protein
MVLSFVTGTVSGSSVETSLFNVSDASGKYYGCHLFLDNMANGDTYVFRIYFLDPVASLMKLYAVQTFSDVQAIPVINIPFIATKQYRVSVQKTAGVDKNFNWNRIEEI